jgi:hypothetical protein
VIDQQAVTPTGGQKTFVRLVRRRLRVASFAVWLRAGDIQVAWLVILGAGAAIPLSEALIDQGWSWVSPTLGFLIVVAAGPYSLVDDRFDLYAQRTEEHIARYDGQMVAYHSQVVREAP